ncbi:Cilia- and flagella-associated protein isoform 1 [Schistosoma japonicum]|uniref:Cilia-and flagella-associated protein isoform 1 n=1 Tax=Schistosoma japonicum TaxID=6182 RepID=A0A4Z2D0A6_SCHJA|nr:Cilia- and flagella-associated protein isoform 1 [Schistosoma japonicum]
MYERHKIALRNLKNANLLGIKIHDLEHYRDILHICSERVQHLPDVYHQHLIELIKLCNKSFLKMLNSDEMTYFNSTVDFMDHFGYLLYLKDVDICSTVCYALEQFYFTKNSMNNTFEDLKIQPTSRKFNQKVICHSNLIESLLKESLLKLRDIFFTLLAQSHSKFCRHLRNDVLTIILLLVKYANTYGQLNEIRIVESGLIRRLVQLVTFDEIKCMNPLLKNLKLLPNDENFDMKRLIISILVEVSHDSAAIYTMSTSGLIKGLFQWICPIIQTTSTPSQSQQQQLTVEPKHDQIQSDFTENTTNNSIDLKPSNKQHSARNCNSHQEVNADNDINHNRISLNSKSFDKLSSKQIQTSNTSSSSSSSSKTTTITNNVSNNDIKVSGDDDYEDKHEVDLIRKWPQAYLEELHLYMLDSLASLAPCLSDDCLTYGIPSRLCILLQWCISSEPFLGQGNSFHGVGGRNCKRAQLRYSLRLIRSLVETNDERIITNFVYHGLIQFLIPLIIPISIKVKSDQLHNELYKFTNEIQTTHYEYQQYMKDANDLMEEDKIGLEMQCDILLILSKLCSTDVERKQMIGTDGVDAINLLLKQLSKRLAIIQSIQYRLLIQSKNKQLNIEQSSFSSTTTTTTSSSSNHLIIMHYDLLIKLAYALTEAVWCCIIGSHDCEDYFLIKDGATHLLNLLEWYPLQSVNYLLGCLVDLTENPKCLPYLSCWSGIHSLNNQYTNEDNHLIMNCTNRNQLKQQLNPLELTTSLLNKSPDIVVSTRLHKIITYINKHTTDTTTDKNNNSSINSSSNKHHTHMNMIKEECMNSRNIDECNNVDVEEEEDDDDDESINIWLNGPSLAQLLFYRVSKGILDIK